jgi:hypothetical protein
VNTIIDILLFPVGVFIEAFVGILYPVKNAKMRRHRHWALLSLAGCIGVVGLICLLVMIVPQSLAIAPLTAVGLVFMFTFLIAGKACAGDAEIGKKRDGT